MAPQYFDRARWGAKQAKPGRAFWPGVRTSRTLHYEGVDVAIAVDQAAEARQVQGIQNYHMNHGYVDIAYTLVVGSLGNVYEGRGRQFRSAANGTNASNNSSPSVCLLIGPNQTPTQAQLDGVSFALQMLRADVTADTVYPHKHWHATSCPGQALSQWITDGFPGSGNVPAPAPKPANPPVVGYFPPYAGTVLQKGSKGTQVRLMQQRLKDRGWSITADGDFGPATDSIVRKFQKEKGLTVDGKVGPATWKALWLTAVTA